MTEFSAERPMERWPSHPGALLEDILPAAGESKTEIASLLGISRQHLHDVLREAKPVPPHVAARPGKLFGDRAAVWLRMQAAYDARHAKREVDLSDAPTFEPV